MAERISFLVYHDWIDMLKMLDDKAQAFDVLCGISDYLRTGEVKEFEDAAASMAFGFMRGQVERDSEKYEKTCKKRAEYGRAGGLAKARNAKQTKQKLENLANLAEQELELELEQEQEQESELEQELEPEPDLDPEPEPENEPVPELYAAAASDLLPSVENSVKSKGEGDKKKFSKNFEEDALDRQMETIMYFRERYKQHTGKVHPAEKPEDSFRIAKTLDEYDADKSFVDAYFGDESHKGLCGDSDCKIYHFASPGVLELCKARVTGSGSAKSVQKPKKTIPAYMQEFD